MSRRYSNPPLLYVKAKLWWHVNDYSHFERLKLFNGKIFSALKSEFPEIENGFKRDIEPFDSVFSNDEKRLVLEVSNNSVSIVSTDENYNWDEFSESIVHAFGVITEILIDLMQPDHLHGNLIYEDYFKCNVDSIEEVRTLANDLKLNFSSDLVENPASFRVGFLEKLEIGMITIDYKTINDKKRDSGLYVNFNVDSLTFEPDQNEIKNWFDSAHEICRSYFDKMIEGNIEKQIT